MSDPNDLLPLRPVEFQVLVSLSQGSKHGYAIIQDAEERGEGAAVPGLATLYRALTRMESKRLIERTESNGEGAEDDRRRPFALTRWGRAVARAEASRLALLLSAARDADLLEGAEGS